MRDAWILLVMSLITSVIALVQSIVLFAKTDEDNIASVTAVCAASLTVIFLTAMAFIFPR